METENKLTNDHDTQEQPAAAEEPIAQPDGASDWAEPTAVPGEAAQQFTEFPPEEPKVRENVLAGFVGAFLFALIGGALYFLIYQMGFIAGICGLITFVLASFGYGLLSGNRKQDSIPGLIAAFVMMLLIIFLAEYLCAAYEIYRAFTDGTSGIVYDVAFIDVLRAMPDFLSEKDILGAVLQDLLFAYALGLVASISNITRAVKARKQSRI